MIFFAHRCGAALRDGQPEGSPFCARALARGREAAS